jgi:hypothetical protein
MDAVTQQDMRVALNGAPSPRRRSTPIADGSPPAWDWSAELSEAERAELVELRRTVADLRADADDARSEAARSRRDAEDLRAGMRQLAAARPWRRRRVFDEIRRSGLL